MNKIKTIKFKKIKKLIQNNKFEIKKWFEILYVIIVIFYNLHI